MTAKDYTKAIVDDIEINTRDYPDFADSFIISAHWPDGTELTDEEIDEMNDDSQLVYEIIQEILF